MLPGFVSGFYSFDDCHIDLARLAAWAGARLVHAEATGIDIEAQKVLLPDGREPIQYDVLSINTGIVPKTCEVPGAEHYTTSVKPIDRFVERFEALLQRAAAPSSQKLRISVVGGGPSGVELACALQYRLAEERERRGLPPAEVALVSKGPILSAVAPYARKAFLPLLQERGIGLFEVSGGVKEVSQSQLHLSDGSLQPFEECLWCTYASPAPWVAESGLPLDADGFIQVNDFLQSDGGPANVFAAGDIASMASYSRPKAGVYAVRAGGPLADNLRCSLLGQPLLPYAPQSTNLNLISAGSRYAIAVKGSWFGLQGGYLWTLKDWIDRKFMRIFGDDLDFEKRMQTAGDGGSSSAAPADPELLALVAASKMRCSGCGAKVGASVLSRVLDSLSSSGSTQEQQGEADGSTATAAPLVLRDDAAVLEPPPEGHVTVHTIDFLRSFISDPWVFGRIAAVHALSDCYAMGATPIAALSIVVLQYAAESKVEADLRQLLAGALSALREAGCALVGGHTAEGAEEALGFSIYGSTPRAQVLPKGGLLPGQALVLTKPIGTGVLLAAAMRGAAKGRWLTAALDGMQQSNGLAVPVLRAHGAAACTDVTGFGLLGHLAEMAASSGSAAHVELDAAAVPLLPGAAECSEQGIVSSLQAGNARVASVVVNGEACASVPLLMDPQTSGGLLAAVPAERADACMTALQAAGYAQAAVVGRVVEGRRQDGKRITLGCLPGPAFMEQRHATVGPAAVV